MATKKIKTPNEQLWEKEVNRLKRFMREASRRGYTFPDNIIPRRPTRITKKALSLIQSIRPADIYKKATYKDPDTDVVFSGEEGRTREAEKRVERRYRQKGQEYIRRPRAAQDDVAAKMNRLIKRGYSFENGIPGEDLPKGRKVKTSDLYKYATYTDPETGAKMSGEEGRKLERKRAAQKAARTRAANKAKEAPDKGAEASAEGEKKQKTEAEPKQKKPHSELNRREKGDSRKIESLPTQAGIIIGNLIEILERYPAYREARDYLQEAEPIPGWSNWRVKVFHHDKNIFINLLNGAIREEGEEAVAQRIEANAEEIMTIMGNVLYGSEKTLDKQVDFARFSSILRGRSLTQEESMEVTDMQEVYEDWDEEI